MTLFLGNHSFLTLKTEKAQKSLIDTENAIFVVKNPGGVSDRVKYLFEFQMGDLRLHGQSVDPGNRFLIEVRQNPILFSNFM